jgi:hypothetical protein
VKVSGNSRNFKEISEISEISVIDNSNTCIDTRPREVEKVEISGISRKFREFQ